MPGPDTNPASGLAGSFRTTQWTDLGLALKAGSPGAGEALERLCQAYWYPLYALLRRRGYSPEDAQDLTQGFFERFLENNYLAQVDREKGKFRSFLSTSIIHFSLEQAKNARSLKRDIRKTVSFDALMAEKRYAAESPDPADPNKLYDHQWALTMMGLVWGRLKQEFAKPDDSGRYDKLKACLLPQTGNLSYAELAGQLGMTESNVKSTVHRMRRRLGELLREEVGRTVGNRAEVEEELHYLLSVVAL
jgi:RNA polymerase sigma-70 factor (ECF subfamily)